MAKKDHEHLISLNGKYLSSYENGEMYAPLRVTTTTAKKIEKEILSSGSPDCSCVYMIASVWDGGKFMLGTEYKNTTKCTSGLKSPTPRTKTDMCAKNLCTGKCRDEFMRNVVAKHILPELYKGKTK